MASGDDALFAFGLILFVLQLALSIGGIAVAWLYRETENIKIRNPAMLAAFSVVRVFGLWISTHAILWHTNTHTRSPFVLCL